MGDVTGTTGWQEATARLTAPAAPFEMEVVEAGGRRFRAWKHAHPHLPSILDASRAFGDRTFLVYEDDAVTFAEHHAAAATFAHRLIGEFGVVRGDRVAIAMRNHPEWPMAFYGAAAAGAVVVPLNAWWKGAELEYGLADSGSRVLVCDGERARLLAEGGHLDTLRSSGLETVVVVRDDDAAAAAGARTWDDALGTVGAVVERPAVDLAPDDDATIFYTSGTTGNPKGALGTHRNICTNLTTLQFNAARQAVMRGREPAVPGAGRQNAYLLSVPFFHATGCHSILLGNTAGGGKLVIMHRSNPERALELIERERITSFGGVPAMVWQVLDSPDFAKRDTSSVQAIGYGGAPAPPELVRRISEHFTLASRRTATA